VRLTGTPLPTDPPIAFIYPGPPTPDQIVKGIVTGSQPAGSLARFVRDIKQADVLFEGTIITATSDTATLNGDATSVCLGQAITIGEEGDIERQTRWVIGFNPSTKVITLDEPWCVIPDNGANYQIIVLRRSLQQGEIDAIVDGAGGSGAIRITITATLAGDGVPGVTFQIAGSVVAARTNTLGIAELNVDPNETYTIRTIVPLGFEAVADQDVEVVADDVAVAVTLATIPFVPADPPGCNVTIPVRSQFTQALGGVHVAIKFIGWQASATKPATILSPPPVVVTDANGLATVVLYRLARYQATYTVDGDTKKVVPFTTPDEGAFVVIEP
jgi:hypothetical protein